MSWQILAIKRGISHLLLPPTHPVWHSDLFFFFPRPESQTGKDKNIQVEQRQRLHPEQTQRTAQRAAGADGESHLWPLSDSEVGAMVSGKSSQMCSLKVTRNISRL